MLDSESSSSVLVLSGAPQRLSVQTINVSVVHNNDITKDVSSLFRLFADNCLLYRVINSGEDTNRPQEGY